MLLGFGLFCRIWVRIGPKGDEALRMGWGGRMYGCTDVRMDGRTDSPCVLQDFVPFGAAALLPLNLNHTLLEQGTSTADHLLPLGCYLAFRGSLCIDPPAQINGYHSKSLPLPNRTRLR